jgi:hypothetical protein
MTATGYVWQVVQAVRSRASSLWHQDVLSEEEMYAMKKNYEKPAIIHSEDIEARAVSCTKDNTNACPGGPITS